MKKDYFYVKHAIAMVATGLILALIANHAEAFDENGDVFCLAKNIYFEAGNQPLAGKLAVSHVVLNRVMSDEYPNDICGVVYQARWFTNWKGTADNVHPYWADSLNRTVTIDQHIFYK